MSELLRRFYEEVVLTEQATIDINCRLDDEVKHIMENHIKGSTADEVTREMCFEIVSLAESEGFYMGLKHAVKVLLEVMSE